MTARVVVVGGINMDLTVWVDRLPLPGETVRGDQVMLHPGGKGANQAVAAARASASTALIGRVGHDSFGDELIGGFERDGLDYSGIVRDADALTGVALIGVDAAGQNTITVGAGANSRVAIDDLEGANRLISSAAVGVLNFEIPMTVVIEAAARFRPAGAKVVLNLSPLYPLPAELLPLVDLLIVNEIEAASVVGEAADPDVLLPRIRSLGIPDVVITLGSAGAVFTDGAAARAIAGHSVDVVDPTAAGDAFLGTLVAGLAADISMLEACRRANVAGALTVSRPGAQPSIPTRIEIDAALAHWSGAGV